MAQPMRPAGCIGSGRISGHPRVDLILSHLSARGEVHMVDVAGKATSARDAVAEGSLHLAPEAPGPGAGGPGKGDVLAVARVAAIQAAKRTAELIPLCHPLPLSGLKLQISEAPLAGAGEAPTARPAPMGLRIEAGWRRLGAAGGSQRRVAREPAAAAIGQLLPFPGGGPRG